MGKKHLEPMSAKTIINRSTQGSWKITDLRKVKEGGFTHVSLDRVKKEAVLFRWGSNYEGNTLEWTNYGEDSGTPTVLALVHTRGDVVSPSGNVILDPSTDDSRWSGKLNRYSPQVAQKITDMLEAGIIQPEARVYFGNWARKDGVFVGKAGLIVRKHKPAQKRKALVLYHGTSSIRLPDIMQNGLRPQTGAAVSWKRETKKGSTPHRSESVYLTADKEQAIYYANKAVKVDRYQIANVAPSWTRYYRGDSPDETDAYLKAIETRHKPKPVLLQVIVPASEYGRLRADDDYWKTKQRAPNLDPWDSLTQFSQVALVGSIPPAWIRQIPHADLVSNVESAQN